MAVNEETKTDDARSTEGRLASTPPAEVLGLVLGVLGGTAVLFGAILYAIDPGVWPLSVGNLVFGVVCAAFYGFTNRRKLARAAGSRSTPLLALEVATALGVIGGALALNWVIAQDPTEWDWTQDGLYTLHAQSVEVAERLDTPIVVYGFYRPTDTTRGVLEQAVELYRMHTDQLRLEFVNPDQVTQSMVERFQLGSKSAPIIFWHEASERFTKIKLPTEEAMTNALMELAEDRQRKVYFLSGHGEPSIRDTRSPEAYGQAAQLLGNEGIRVESLSLVDRSDVPDDASAVLVARPRTPLLPNEVAALKVFLDRGGRVGVLLEPSDPHGLTELLRPYAIEVGNDLVVDDNPASKALGFGADAPVVQTYETHPITDVMTGRFTMFFRARSVSPRIGVAKVSVATLVQTSDDAFAETSTVGGAPSLDENDLAGPVPIAVAATKRTAQHPRSRAPEARLVVFGDADFAGNRFTAMVGNVDLFVNTVNWLVGDEDRITIRPPQKTGDRLPLTALQQYGIMFFAVNLLPLLIVGFGFAVWAVRRRR